MDYKIVLKTSNLNNAKDKIKKAVELLVDDVKQDSDFSFINEILLHRIIITESSKVYHNKDVDDENEKGFYKTYKQVVQRVSDFILDFNSKVNIQKVCLENPSPCINCCSLGYFY